MNRLIPEGSSDSQDDAFRLRVLTIATSLFPERTFKIPPESESIILADGVQLGLQNLKAKFELSDQSAETLKLLVRRHFELAAQVDLLNSEFHVIEQSLRPQLMPPDFADQAPIISFLFGKTLAIGIVLDTEENYSYITKEDAVRWNKPGDELLDIAIANLGEAIRGKTKLSFFDNEDAKWAGVETKDGFDAARILIPGFQAFLASRLGSPFQFAIPNRDFLICWNVAASSNFTESIISKVQIDFESQPYPLSPNVFQIESNGTVSELI